MIRLVIALVIGGGVLAFFGYQEWSLASGTDSEPRQITCQELIDDGPGDNAHIEMGDFLLCEFSYVYEGNSEFDMDKVWVPAVPLGGDYHMRVLAMMDEQGNIQGDLPTPQKVHVIVKSSKVSSDSDVSDLGAQETLKGMVVNKVSSLASEEKKLLKESYPSIDFDNVWIIEHGRQPAGFGKVFAMIGGGLALMLVGGVLGFGTMGQE